MTWAVLQHASREGPGIISSEARQRAMSMRTVRLDQGQSLPNAREVGGLIVMGGPMGVYEHDKYTSLIDESQLIAVAVQLGIPVFGVCSEHNYWLMRSERLSFVAINLRQGLDQSS
jgi:GMP synthase-like glutamine amidotransferase